MYYYYLPNGVLLCKSKSEVMFNKKELPAFANIKPIVEKVAEKQTKKEMEG
jgi:hypothetical protein